MNRRSEDSPSDPWRAVSAKEFLDRQDRLRNSIRDLGFDGAIVWSRGGAFVDMHADVLYLTNHYSQQPYMGDEAGIGSGRAHGACFVPSNGPVVLIVDIPWWRPDLVVADDVRESIHVPQAAAAAVREAGLGAGRLALVGASYMTAATYLALVDELVSARLERADQLVERLRRLKSPSEIDLIRRVCALGDRTMETLMGGVVEGATEAQAVAEASRALVASGGVLYDAVCTSGPEAAEYAWARLPSADPHQRFRPGDMFHVDCYGAYGGYLFDFARSRVVGDDPSPIQRRFLEAVIEGVEVICSAIRPGVTGGEVYSIAEEWLAQSEVGASVSVYGSPADDSEIERFPAVGHGVGLGWEAPWLRAGDTTVVEPGMYLAAELFFRHPGVGGVMFEQNGIVTNEGFEVLTEARARWW